MRAIGYVRVSHAEQVDRGTSLADQRSRIKAFVKARGWTLVDLVEDAGISGADQDRPGLARIRSAVNSGHATVVVATKIDRIQRSAAGLVNLVEWLLQHDAGLALVDEALDTTTDSGRLTASLLGVVAGFERDRIRERTVTGRRNAALEGRFVASTPPFGYRAVPAPDGRGKILEIEPSQAATIRAILTLVVYGRGDLQSVVDILNADGHRRADGSLWTRERLSNWIQRDVPLRNASGTWKFDGIELQIPAILTPTEYTAWKDFQTLRRRGGGRSRGPYLLAGMVTYPCGRNGMGRTAGTQAATYVCRDHLYPRGDPRRHKDCLNIRAETLEGYVKMRVRSLLSDLDTLSAVINLYGNRNSDDRVNALVAELATLDRQMAEAFSDLQAAGVRGSAVALAFEPMVTRQRALEMALTDERRRHVSAARVAAGANLAALDLSTTSLAGDKPTFWRELLLALDVRITVTGFAKCETCSGSGYKKDPDSGADMIPHVCPSCLRHKTVPHVVFAADDAVAYALALRLDATG